MSVDKVRPQPSQSPGPLSHDAPDPLRAFSEIEQHFAALKTLHAQAAQRDEELAKLSASVEERERQVQATSVQLERDRAELRAKMESLQAEQQQATQRAEELSRRQQAIEEAERGVQRVKDEARAAAEQIQKDRAAVEADLSKLLEREGAVADKLRQAEEDQKSASMQAEKALKKHSDDLAQRARVIEEMRAELVKDQQELVTGQQRLAEMARAVNARKVELEDREKALAARAAHLEAQAKGVAEADSLAVAQTKDLEAAMAEKSALLASRDAQVARLTDQLDELEKRLAAASSAPAPDAGLQATLAKREETIEILAERLKEAQDRLQELESGAGSIDGLSMDGPEGDAHNELRRKRLARYKSLLQTQTRKIVQAQAALAKRQGEAEQVLALRAKLNAKYDEVVRRENQLAGVKARTATAAIAFYAVGVLGVLAFLSWMAAVQFAPATFVACATIESDARSRKVKDEDVEAWQQYHNQLVSDPGLMQQVAERLGRRGIVELGEPAAAQAFFKAHLDVDSPRNGVINVKLTGDNPTRCATVLDTYVTTLVGDSNNTRLQRPDGIGSEITTPVHPPPSPVKDQRLEYAGAIFGGSSFLSFTGSLIVGARLRRAKKTSEADADMTDDERSLMA